MDGLSPETRDLLARAEGGDELPKARRLALRRRIAGALGVAVPLASARTSSAPIGKHGWLRGSSSWGWQLLGAVGIVGAVSAAVAVARFAHRAPAAGPAIQTAPAVVAPALQEEPVRVERVEAPSDVGLVARAFPVVSAAPPVASAAPPIISRAIVPLEPAAPSRSARRAPIAPSEPAPSAPMAAPAPAPSVGSDLAAEAHLLAKAQAALGAGRGTDALTLLNEHDARFPNGTLAPESGALRVRALCVSGRMDEARAQTERLRARFPSAVPASPCGAPPR